MNTAGMVMTVTDELLAELEELAAGVKGWNMTNAFQEPEEGFLPEDLEWYVGQIDEDDNRYPVLNVNAHQYDSEDSEKLAQYYAACNRDKILSMTQELRRLRAENAELAKDAGRWRYAAKQDSAGEVDICITQVTWNIFSETYRILTAENADSITDRAMATQ